MVPAAGDLGAMTGESVPLDAENSWRRSRFREAVVSNAGGAGVLAVDACADAGLTVPVVDEATRRVLARVLPSCAAVGNPVDTPAALSADVFREVVELVAADDAVDAVPALVVPTASAICGSRCAPAASRWRRWDGEQAVRAAFGRLSQRFGVGLEGMLVQVMAEQGVEVLCGAVQDEVFGAVVIFGSGASTPMRWPTALPGSRRSPRATVAS
jgi:acyl-CoA synthetase (NDP forming)